MAAPSGLEPELLEPESSVLPIAPQGNEILRPVRISGEDRR